MQHNTAAVIVLGPMVDWRDSKTLLVETPTLTDLACTLYKNGVAETKSLAGSLTVDAEGMALLDLSAADTDTVGRLDVLLRNAVIGGYPTDVILPRGAALTVAPAGQISDVLTALDQLSDQLGLVPTAPSRAGIY